MKQIKQVMRNAIKKHAGLSDFDNEWVDLEVDSILKEVEKTFKIVPKRSQKK